MTTYADASDREYATIVDVLRCRAGGDGRDETAFTFLDFGDREPATLSFGELHVRACSIAARLHARYHKGTRALLLFSPGLEFVCGLFGCLYAGILPVPAYPQLRRGLPRLKAIMKDAEPTLVLTTSNILRRQEKYLSELPETTGTLWLSTVEMDPEATCWSGQSLTRQDPALVQYTSGSTSAPQGVVLSHENLSDNLELICRTFRITRDDVVVSWLPPYHDMGLIGKVLGTVWYGTHTILMSPQAFAQNPIRWLWSLTRFGGTLSAAPNFAYDLCTRQIGTRELDNLDLSSWRCAINGAEPVSCQTLEKFAAKFRACGFRRRSFFPCYGLAEATLLVAGKHGHTGPAVATLSAGHLGQHEVRETRGGMASQIASCGAIDLEHPVLIVDPMTHRRCSQGQVGEIWLKSRSVAGGYLNKECESSETFGAYLAETGEGPFLRTGDLGFKRDGELYVAGRIKDMIIVRGRNHYPQDIEKSVEESHWAVGVQASAAFSRKSDPGEALVVVAEVGLRPATDPTYQAAPSEVIDAIRQAVGRDHEVQVHTVVLVKPRTIPKTTSGKIQRNQCRQAFLGGTLQVLETHSLDDSALPGTMARAAAQRQPLLDHSASRRRSVFLADDMVIARTPAEKTLVQIWRHVLKIDQVCLHRRNPDTDSD